LSDEAGNASIYEFVNNTTAEDLSAAIKKVLKIDGSFKTETYGVDTSNGTESITYYNLQSGAINVYVSDTNNALTFNYSNADAWVMGECVKEESSSDIPGATYCVENAPVKATLPTDKQAVTRALEVFSGLGFETTAADIVITRAEDSLYAFAPIKVDGKSTGLSWDISWGNTGKISGVNGYAVDVVKVADVATISAKDTVKRMSDYRWMASGSAELYNAASTISSRTADSVTSGEVEKQIMKIEKATAVLAVVYDSNGKMWVVPSFAMYAENDSYPLVYVSVADGVIKLPEPMVGPEDGLSEPRVKTETNK